MDWHTLYSIAILAAFGVLASIGAAAADEPASRTAPAVMAELQTALAQRELWPGYDPMEIPVAIFDGTDTYLFHHPAPPEGFTPSAGDPAVAVYPGRHPLIVANTAVELGGVTTATFMPSIGAGGTARANAAVIAHEAFHVYQFAHHSGWSANEAELFTFPKGDRAWLAARQLEQQAYRAALAAPDARSCAAWAALALAQREAWDGVLTLEQQTYLRELERMEGLAAYIQTVTEHPDAPDPSILGNSDFKPEETRRQSYYIGTLQALALDRLAPGWQQRLEEDDTQYLADMLAAALPAECAPAQFTLEQLAQARAEASTASAEYTAMLVRQRADFDALPGWRVIVVAADASPLGPQGFDPMNVVYLGEGRLLHRRFLRLGNESGSLELMGGQALTVAAGPHPLFTGVKRVEFHGLGELALVQNGAHVKLNCDNFTLEFNQASVKLTDDQEYIVLLDSLDEVSN